MPFSRYINISLAGNNRLLFSTVKSQSLWTIHACCIVPHRRRRLLDHIQIQSGVPCEFLFIVSNLTASIHLPPRLLGNHQICLDSVRQCPPHLSVGLWASAEICFPKPSYNHHTPTCGKTSPVMKLWPCFGRLVYKNFCILSRFSEIIDNQRNKFHQISEFGAGFWTTGVGWVLQFALFS